MYEYPFSWLAGQTPLATPWEKIALKHTPNADIIFNPNSGPGGGPGSPEYADYTWAVDVIDAAPGLKPVAYIATTWGAKPLADIQIEIDKYLAWYPQTVGFFLDEADTSLAKLPYYQSIVNMIDASMGGGNRRVIINFGTYPLTDDHFKMTPTNNSFISFVTFEGLYLDYLALVPPAWAANYDPKMHVHMVYKTAFANYQAVMALAQARNVKNIYVTSDWQS